jgi:catechol 2,3-dioxygenase-like lactoylglutathione lyase family enzyme
VDHVGISVSNFEGTVEWYKAAFGLHEDPSDRLDDPEEGIRVALLSGDNGFRLEIMSKEGSVRRASDYKDPVGGLLDQGYHHWAFTVTDLDAALEQLVAAGATLAWPKHEIRSHNVLYGHILDPEGNLVELVQPVAVNAEATGAWARLRYEQGKHGLDS